jgi:hypothetical protein
VKASVRRKGPSPRGIPLSAKTSYPVVKNRTRLCNSWLSRGSDRPSDVDATPNPHLAPLCQAPASVNTPSSVGVVGVACWRRRRLPSASGRSPVRAAVQASTPCAPVGATLPSALWRPRKKRREVCKHPLPVRL